MTTYLVNFTNISTTPISLGEGDVDITSTDIALFGRTRLEYGELLNESLLHILENFSCPESEIDPNTPNLDRTIDDLLINPVLGQFWHNTTTGTIHFWDGEYWIPLRRGDDMAANWGQVANGELLPRPVSPTSGYVFPYEECIWSVSPAQYVAPFSVATCTTDLETSQVTMEYFVDDETSIAGTANYLIIGIRYNTDVDVVEISPTPTPSVTPPPTNVPGSPTPTPPPSASGTPPPPSPTRTPTRTPPVTPTRTPTRTPPVSPPPTPTPTPSTTPPSQNVWSDTEWRVEAFDQTTLGNARAQVQMFSDGTARGRAFNNTLGWVVRVNEDWHSGAPTASDPGQFEVRLRIKSGDAPEPGSPAPNVWTRLDSNIQWQISVQGPAGQGPQQRKAAEWYIDVRRNPTAGPAEGIVTKLVTVEANATGPNLL